MSALPVETPSPAEVAVALGPADEARLANAWAQVAAEHHDRSMFDLRPLLEVFVELRHGTVVGVGSHDGSLAAFGWNLPLPEVLEPYVFAQLGHTEVGYVRANAVVPAHRGRRLQRVVAGALLDELVAAGHRWAAITVSPTNTASLRNLRACGFMQVGRGPVYGDHERLVLMKELA